MNLKSDVRNSEARALEQFGLRWAILAGWRDDLSRRGVRIDAAVPRTLEAARTKIASGCFSSCEVGCDLAQVEAALVAACASSEPEAVDSWLDVLGQAMASPEDVKKHEVFEAVVARYIDCGYRPCNCAV